MLVVVTFSMSTLVALSQRTKLKEPAQKISKEVLERFECGLSNSPDLQRLKGWQ